MQPIIMLVLLTLTLAFGLTGPWGERLAPAAIAQVSPAQAPDRGKSFPGPNRDTGDPVSGWNRLIQGQLGVLSGSPR